MSVRTPVCKVGFLMAVFLDFGTFMLWRDNRDRLKARNHRQVYTSERRKWWSVSAQSNATAPRAEQKHLSSQLVEWLQAHTWQLHSQNIAQELINRSHKTSSSTGCMEPSNLGSSELLAQGTLLEWFAPELFSHFLRSLPDKLLNWVGFWGSSTFDSIKVYLIKAS